MKSKIFNFFKKRKIQFVIIESLIFIFMNLKGFFYTNKKKLIDKSVISLKIVFIYKLSSFTKRKKTKLCY